MDDAGTWRYEYYYKDHLGHTRLGFSDLNGAEEVDETEIIQQSNYYPFGLQHSGQNFIVQGSEHKYKYNGKELQDELSMNWLDYGARNYDAAVGRWFSVDPAANLLESSSPYVYALNSPLVYIDTDGELPILINGRVGGCEDGCRGNESYWAAEVLSVIENSGIANPGGQYHFVDGDQYYPETGAMYGSPNNRDGHWNTGNNPSDSKRAGAKQASMDFGIFYQN